MSKDLTVRVSCEGNYNSYYDGKTWDEKVQHIVEHNEKPFVFDPLTYRHSVHGDTVVVKFPR